MRDEAAGFSFLNHIILIAGVLAGSALLAQDEITRRQSELESMREGIRKSEVMINQHRTNEKATLELLDAYDQKSTLVRKLISRLRVEELRIQKQVDSLKVQIETLGGNLAFLKDHYARYVASVYKAGKLNELELLLTARSINQALIRSEYLQRFSDQRRIDANRIVAKKRDIEDLQVVLQERLTEQRRTLAEKGAEEDHLAVLIEDRQDVLREIRKDRKTLQKELERKMKAVRELEDLVASLIEAERLRKEKVASQSQPEDTLPGLEFHTRKGRLPWPVGSGKIVARFGNHTHPTLKTVTQNPGVDIAVPAGTEVRAVANGRVARIWWLVSYGNLIILDHGGGYRTIYAHLAEIMVSEGEEIAEGSIMASSGESVDGARIHFEIWKEREKQNPEQWLARR